MSPRLRSTEEDKKENASLGWLRKVYLMPVQLVGGVGTGKTCTAVRFAEQLNERAVNLKHVYVNLRLQGGNRVVLYHYPVEKATHRSDSSKEYRVLPV